MSRRANIYVKLSEEDIGKMLSFNPKLIDGEILQMDSFGYRKISQKEIENVYKNGAIEAKSYYISCYLHFGNILTGIGKVLIKKYNTYEKALNLVLAGNLSSVTENNIVPYCLRRSEYGFKNGVNLPKPNDAPKPCTEDIEFIYLFGCDDGKCGWYVRDVLNNEDFVDLETELNKINRY